MRNQQQYKDKQVSSRKSSTRPSIAFYSYNYEAYPETKFRFYLYRSSAEIAVPRMPGTLSIKREEACVIYRSQIQFDVRFHRILMFTMSVFIENPASCEIRYGGRFSEWEAKLETSVDSFSEC
ncbi:hypothetical protein TNCV_3713991 [Trichonephila clavipes]|nr:hypothetical protein TNCV_3713991 [Trichonephila clavipes]